MPFSQKTFLVGASSAITRLVIVFVALTSTVQAQHPLRDPEPALPWLQRECVAGTSCSNPAGRSIVILKAPSISEALNHSRAAPMGQWSLKAQQVAAAQAHTLKGMHASASKKLGTQKISVERAFSVTINALVVNAPLSLAEANRILPGQVLSVSEDRPVKAFLDQSVPLIHAPEVWAQTTSAGVPLTGRGLRIGVIDTGIDYTHADLGGCTRTANINDGSCSKVIGGYDFVNNDNDPFDDHGHGTHCASTAAGDGVLRGVAPEASLVAYKVLAVNGSGLTSDVIAAIERSADPNGDGSFDDRLDVISLSLGADGGDPNTPDALALDRVVSLGVVAVVAAGNAGPEVLTIGTPGTSRRAVTVGAFSKNREIASFSSRGPVRFKSGGKDFELSKPDISAPGVDICAAASSVSAIPATGRECVDSAHIKLSGTSMATPHVAGVAALVRQAHPTWSPDEVKTAMTSSAPLTPLNGSLNTFDTGSGAVDALAAVTSPSGIAVIEEIERGSDTPTVALRVPVGWSYDLSFTQTTSLSQLSTASWQALASGVAATTSFVTPINTSQLPQGNGTLRLQALSPTGDTLTDYNTLPVERFELTNPTEGDVVNMIDPLQVQVTKHSDLSPDSISIAYSVNGGAWTSEGVIADLATLTGTIQLPASADTYSLKVRATLGVGGLEDIITSESIRVEPRLRAGFPVRVPNECANVQGSGYLCQNNWVLQPAIGDIDGDGVSEIVVWRNRLFPTPNELIIINNQGAIIRTLPLAAHPLQRYLSPLQFVPWPIAITDLDGDGRSEIVVVESFTSIFQLSPESPSLLTVYNGDGTVRPGFPLVLEGINLAYTISDLNRDGRKEIVVVNGSSSFTSSTKAREVFIVSDDGTIVGDAELPATQGRVSTGGFEEGRSPLIGNFDNDEDLEVAYVHTTINKNFTSRQDAQHELSAYVINWDDFGVRLPLLQQLPGFYFGSAAVIDEDGDGKHEITVPAIRFDTSDEHRVYHLRESSGALTVSTSVIPLADGACPFPSPNFCGYYDLGMTVGRLKGSQSLAVLGIAYKWLLATAQPHIFKDGQVVGYAAPTFTGRAPQSPPVLVDVTGDGENDIIFADNSRSSNQSTRGISVMTSESDYETFQTLATERNFFPQGFASTTVADIDNDGSVEIVTGSLGDGYLSKPLAQASKKRFSIYAFSSAGTASAAQGQWNTFLGNSDHSGCLDCARTPAPLNDPGPVLVSHPQSIAVPDGSTTTLSVTASGNNLRYQWERAVVFSTGTWVAEGWFPIPEATQNTLVVTSHDYLQFNYRVRVSTKTRSVMSDTAEVRSMPRSCPINAPKAHPGVCGCSEPDDDLDQDGTVDCVERRRYVDMGPVSVRYGRERGRMTVYAPSIPNASRYTVTLLKLDSRGRVTKSFKRTGTERRFPFERLPRGTYRIRWTTKLSGVPSLTQVSGALLRIRIK